MANEEHLAKLKEGVEAWNEWRKKNPDLQPDLQGAHLSQAQLQGINLSRAQLQKANLSEAQLQKANLYSAQLQNAILGRTWLQGANLSGAQLQGANLYSAQLQGADLGEAFFDNTTRLYGVILGDDTYGGASLADVNWGGVNLAVVDWSELKMLGDEDQARRFGAWLLEFYQTAVRANRQLAVVLRDQGLNEEADRFAYRAQVLQRKVFWMQKKFGRGFFSGFLALVAGYGYRMERILFTYAIVVSLFAVAYFVLGIYYEPHLSFLDAVLTSVTAFHGRVFSEPFLHPGEPQLWVTAFEAVAGLIVEGVFIAMLTQRFFGR